MKRAKKAGIIFLTLTVLLAFLTGCITVKPTGGGYVAEEPSGTWEPEDPNWGFEESETNINTNGNSGESYTVMVYMVGSDLESENSAASNDIVEMIESGLDTSKHNVVVYTGGSSEWALGIPSGSNCILELKANDTPELVKEYGHTLNMGEADTFRDFIDYCYANYHTDNYALICWDHGGGPLMGFGCDELYEWDSLLLMEMEEALKNSALAKGNKLEWVGFDACLMSSIELANVWKDYADYMIASQEIEAGCGWDYSFLRVLNETDNTVEIAKHLIDTYKMGVENSVPASYNPPITLSCMDLSKTDTVIRATDQLFSAMDAGLDAGDYYELYCGRSNTKSFAEEATGGERGLSYDVVDMGDMAAQLRGEYTSEVAGLQNAIEEMVVYEVSNVNDTCGVSIYYPHNGDQTFYDWGEYLYEITSVADSYSSYIGKYTDMWLNGQMYRSSKLIVPKQIETTDEITVQLTEEQTDNLVEATYTVMQKVTDGSYYPVLIDCHAEVDDDHVVHLPKENRLFCLETDLGEELVLPVVQIEDRNGVKRYAAQDFGMDVAFDYDITSSQWSVMSMKEEQGRVQMESLMAEADDSLMFGKQSIDISKYNVVKTVFEEYLPTYNGEGDVLPYSEWNVTGTQWVNTAVYDTDFTLKVKDGKEMGAELICQVVLKDSEGNVYATEIMDIPGVGKPKHVEKKTPNGSVEYVLYDKHAEVYRYEGTDTEIVIPDEIDGKPVTVIGEYAFGDDSKAGFATKTAAPITSIQLPETIEEIRKGAFRNCVELDSVELPETLSEIGVFAFAGCAKIKTLIVPKSVEIIGDGAFAECDALQKLEVDGNDKYVMADDVLFTKDMKTLLAYTGAGVKSYKVPDGVEEIADYAFLGMDKLEDVEFPDSVRTIGVQSFYNCMNYTNVILGDGVENIGAGAFATGFTLGIGDSSAKVMDKIHFGKQIKWMDETAFENVAVKAFDVAKENEVYSSNEGMLLSKAGDVLVRCCMQDGSVLEIPEGIAIIGRGAFDNCGDNVTELVLPDSLQMMDKNLTLPGSVKKATIGAGLRSWGNVSAFANVSDLTISEKNPYFSVVEKVVYDKDQTILYLYPSGSVKTDTKFEVPAGVKQIKEQAICSDKLEEIVLSKAFEKVGDKDANIDNLGYMSGLKSISVASGNAKYTSKDGIIYSKDGKVLLYCPKARTEPIHVKEGVEEIGEHAISYLSAQEVHLPDSLKMIHTGNFIYLDHELEKDGKQCHVYLPDNMESIAAGVFERRGGAVISADSQYEASDGFVVHVKAGSDAEKIAKERGFKIEYIK